MLPGRQSGAHQAPAQMDEGWTKPLAKTHNFYIHGPKTCHKYAHKYASKYDSIQGLFREICRRFRGVFVRIWHVRRAPRPEWLPNHQWARFASIRFS